MDPRVHPLHTQPTTELAMLNQYPQRKSPRKPGYDYAQPGAYFVTICTQNRKHLFGHVDSGKMHSNDAGRMVEQTWCELALKFPFTRLDAFIAMPNHVHAIIWLTTDPPIGMDPCVHPPDLQDGASGPARGPVPTEVPTLSDVVRWYKSFTTAKYRHGVVNADWLPFPGRLWQHSFYDHIVRRDEALNAIRRYIVDNPARWQMDLYNPDSATPDPRAAQIWRMLKDEEAVFTGGGNHAPSQA